MRTPLFALTALLALVACSGGESSSTATTGGGGDTTTSATTGEGGAATTTSSTGAGGSGGAAEVSPPKPQGLTSYLTGDDADAPVNPTGPALILMGGGPDVDAAFAWWKPYLNGGDVVVLRASGADGYNDYLYSQIGGADSVETLLVTSPALADSDYVKWRIAHAEGVFLAGGDQADYLAAWKDRGVETALMEAWKRGAVIGGTSAGCAVLGELVFGAAKGSVYSDEALTDPYNPYMTMDRGFLALPPLAGVITDTHFAARDRMGRLVAFLARILTDGWADEALGLGVDEGTALVIEPAGQGTVLGAGAVYAVNAAAKPTTCAPKTPLEYPGLTYRKLVAGDTIQLPAGVSKVPAAPLSASGGALTPADPY